ncbi:hypothetical protein [Chryseobacterium proteolyticum]|uniref:hypothetical protein n=1 Tax=Chryseobacterium proteolyticum TaxID=118127 RepID=UPI0039833F0E
MKINLEELKQIIPNIKLEEDNSYLISYPYFINYFKLKDRLSKQDLICGVFMIYGWMPTILKNIDCTDIDKIVDLFNKAKSSDNILTEIEIENLKPFTNKSLVGLSKLLHFINPNVYPIWDSKICKYFFSNGFYSKIGNVSIYLEYVDAIKETIKFGLPNDFDNLREQLGYKITDVRLIELVIFLKPV